MIKTIIILTKKLGEIPSEYIAGLKQDKTVLEVIADNNFDIQDIKILINI